MKKDKLSELSLQFAKFCCILADELKAKKEYCFADQIKRSSTSICANIAEAGHPQSKADRISKFEIALKEAFETDSWLKMITNLNLISTKEFENIEKIGIKIRVLLIASIKTLKEN